MSVKKSSAHVVSETVQILDDLLVPDLTAMILSQYVRVRSCSYCNRVTFDADRCNNYTCNAVLCEECKHYCTCSCKQCVNWWCGQHRNSKEGRCNDCMVGCSTCCWDGDTFSVVYPSTCQKNTCKMCEDCSEKVCADCEMHCILCRGKICGICAWRHRQYCKQAKKRRKVTSNI